MEYHQLQVRRPIWNITIGQKTYMEYHHQHKFDQIPNRTAAVIPGVCAGKGLWQRRKFITLWPQLSSVEDIIRKVGLAKFQVAPSTFFEAQPVLPFHSVPFHHSTELSYLKAIRNPVAIAKGTSLQTATSCLLAIVYGVLSLALHSVIT